jgi:hypothetical protein
MRRLPAQCLLALAPFIFIGTPAKSQKADPPPAREGFWTAFVLGFSSSVLFHEAGHVAASLALGARPRFAMEKGRPTIFSGIDSDVHPHKQFIFSSAGLTAQSVLDEGILDVRHAGGAAFERGVLAGGIGTALFYITLGRNASVSDISFMSKTSSLSKTDVSLIYGGIAALHMVRIARDGRYANFFVRPARERGLMVGVRLAPADP